MNRSSTNRLVHIFVLVALTLHGSAVAAVTDPEPPSEKEPAGEAQEEQAPQPEPARPQAHEEAAPGGVERMPPTAWWPAPYLRGIHGGSLYFSPFHGLQWPYYPRTGIGISGDAWLDTGYEKLRRGDSNLPQTNYQIQQGRFVLRITPTFTTQSGWFAQAQAELVANKDQTLVQPSVADTDDLFIRVGKWNSWDIQAGRYQAWEIYHFGMGLDLNTLERNGAFDQNIAPPEIYGVTFAFYRPAGVGNVALHLYPSRFLRFELLGQVGNELGQNALAGRPVAILDFGWLKLKGGAEYKKTSQQNVGAKENTILRGGGGAVQLILDPYLEFGLNAGYALVDHTDTAGSIDQGGSFTTYSVGGFANLRIVEDVLLGVGINATNKVDIKYDATTDLYGEFTHQQSFVALQYYVKKQLLIKLVVAYAKAHLAPTFGNAAYDNEMTSARLRLAYFF